MYHVWQSTKLAVLSPSLHFLGINFWDIILYLSYECIVNPEALFKLDLEW